MYYRTYNTKCLLLLGSKIMARTVFQNADEKTKKLPVVFYRNGNVPNSVRI
jgi:hypothetical protein